MTGLDDDSTENIDEKNDNLDEKKEDISTDQELPVIAKPIHPLDMLDQVMGMSDGDRERMLAENIIMDITNGMSIKSVADRYHVKIAKVAEYLQNNHTNIEEYHKNLIEEKIWTVHQYVSQHFMEIIRNMMKYEQDADTVEIKFMMAKERTVVMEKYARLFIEGPVLQRQRELHKQIQELLAQEEE